MNDLYFGVDPGIRGGICVIDADRVLGDDYLSLETATERDIWDFFRFYVENSEDSSGRVRMVACIEKIPPAIFGIKKSDAAKLYGSYRELRMCLIASKIPFHEVDAKVWQKEIGIKKLKNEKYPKWKQRLRSKAQSLFPQENGSITLATCDALLLAEYARRKHS